LGTIARSPLFCLSFTKGSGAGWGLTSYEEAAQLIRDEIKGIIDVIKTLYNLENYFQNQKAFCKRCW